MDSDDQLAQLLAQIELHAAEMAADVPDPVPFPQCRCELDWHGTAIMGCPGTEIAGPPGFERIVYPAVDGPSSEFPPRAIGDLHVIAYGTYQGIQYCVQPAYDDGLCGYVRIPDHVRIDPDTIRTHYGAPTYQDADTGWIGFFTTHFGDWWADDDLARWGITTQRRAMAELAPQLLETTESLEKYRRGGRSAWTLNRMRVTLKSLIDQIIDRADIAV